MLKKWLLTGVLVLALALLGLFAPWWWPRLLDLAGTQSARIQGLASLVQIVLWLGAAAVAVVRLWLQRSPRKADPPARPSLVARGGSPVAVDGGVAARQAAVGGNVHGNVNAPSIERLDIHVEAPAARDFLRGLGLGPQPDLEASARVYLQFLVDTYRYLDLRGMGISDRVALKLPLLEMYVPLKARLHTPEGETWARQLRVAGRTPDAEEGADMGERLSAPVPVLDLLQKHDGLVLLGDPGAGKTTFLKVLALALASGQGETLGLGGRLPILSSPWPPMPTPWPTKTSLSMPSSLAITRTSGRSRSPSEPCSSGPSGKGALFFSWTASTKCGMRGAVISWSTGFGTSTPGIARPARAATASS